MNFPPLGVHAQELGNNIIIHIFIQFLVSCLEHLYRETEKESTKYPCALDSRGTILEKEIKQTNVTAC